MNFPNLSWFSGNVKSHYGNERAECEDYREGEKPLLHFTPARYADAAIDRDDEDNGHRKIEQDEQKLLS